uniref:Cell adhesion molecule 4 n=1 Tax=Magallana gigas TaxID=29159 RepID=K1R1Q4_MAGGI
MYLREAVDIHNVTLIPSANPLTIQEDTQLEVRCVVNSNAAPAPTITWYLESANITSIAVTNTTFITLTGNRTNNNKTLQCRATNNNNKPPKTANTTLNVEYPPTINTLAVQNKIEGRDLLVTCQATSGNPSSTTFYWTKVDNQDPPTIKTLSQQDIVEGRALFVTCQATPRNPNSTTFYWIKVDNPGFRQNGLSLQVPNIQRTSSGTYRCTAENIYINGEKGQDSQTMVVNVLCGLLLYSIVSLGFLKKMKTNEVLDLLIA